MTYRPARRHAHPRKQYDWRLLFEALLFGFALFVLIVVASVGYAP